MADLIVNSWWSFVGSGVNLFDDCWWSLDIISITISEIKSHRAFWYNFFVDFVLGRLWRSVFVSTSFSFELLVFSGWWSLCGFWCGLPAKASVQISVVFVSKVFCICGWWSLCGFWKFGVGSLRRHPSGYRELYLCQKYFVFVSKVFCICGWWSLVVGDLCVGFGVGSLRRHPSGYREATAEGARPGWCLLLRLPGCICVKSILYLCQKYFVFVSKVFCIRLNSILYSCVRRRRRLWARTRGNVTWLLRLTSFLSFAHLDKDP